MMAARLLALAAGVIGLALSRVVTARERRGPRPKTRPNFKRLTHRLRNTADTVQASGLTKTEAEELLDWLEGQGYRVPCVSLIPGQGFTVSYRRSQTYQ